MGQSSSAQSQCRYTVQEIDLQNRVIKINKDPYIFRRELGSGAFGCVYSARRLPGNSPVAVKVVSLASFSSGESEILARSILNEIEMSKRLSRASKHVVRMFDFDFDRHTGLAFLVMELGEKNLEAELTQRGHLSARDRHEVWSQLVDIAMTLHKNDIVHLDIKPDNLVVFHRNRVKLVDLGIAQKSYEKSVGRNGTWLYSAPEVTTASRNHVLAHTSKADVWSWGAVLFRMTYDNPPSYDAPCHYPPKNQRKTQDTNLNDLLRYTLVLDPRERVDVPWLIRHPYTIQAKSLTR